MVDNSGDSSGAVSERVVALIEMHRRRRLHIQLPLLAAAAVLVLSGGGTLVLYAARPAWVPFTFRWAYAPLLMGGWLIALATMPGDGGYMRALLGAQIVLSVAVLHRQVPLTADMVNQLRAALASAEPIEARQLAFACSGAIAWCASTAVTLVLVTATSCCLLLASFARVVSAFRLNALGWKQVCVAIGALGLSYACFAVSELLRDPMDAEHVAVYCFLALITLGMATVGLGNSWLRSRVHGFLALRGHDVTAAAGIAEMLDGVRASSVLKKAASSFRAVALNELALEHLQHGPRMMQPANSRCAMLQAFRRLLASRSAPQPAECTVPGHGPANSWQSTRDISLPAKLGCVDVFVSHSWHDPPSAKWAALQTWGAQFRAAHGREPLLWIDRCCIDQADIAAQLPSLPVYLAGCNRLLVLLGPSYLQRLWCVVELYVFYQAHLPTPPKDKIVLIPLRTQWAPQLTRPREFSSLFSRTVVPMACEPALQPSSQATLQARSTPGASVNAANGDDELTAARSAALAAAAQFDVRKASATVPSDAERLLAVIESHYDSSGAFSPWIRSLVLSKLQEPEAAEPSAVRVAEP